MIGNITKRSVDALPQGATLWDATISGFGCRRQLGTPTYVVKFRIHGRQRFVTLGKHGHLTPDTARREAQKLLGQVAAGNDPAAAKAQAKLAAADTLNSVAQAYLDAQRPKLRPRSFVEIERYLLIDWAPLHGLPIASVTRRQIAQRINELATETGPVAATRARTALSAMFNWALGEGYDIPANPVTGTNKPATAQARERVLTQEELRAVWLACGDDDYGRIIRLLILTGQRREEIGAMTWGEITGDVFTIPANRAKNHRENSLPLTPMALSLLPPRRNSTEYVFGNGAAGFSSWSQGKAKLDAATGITTPFVTHDIRRSVATHLGELGVLPHIIETILNHVSGHRAGVAGIYNRARHSDAVREALTKWSGELQRIIRPKSLTLVRAENRT
jgi:integrase